MGSPTPPEVAHRAIETLRRLTEVFRERRAQLARSAALTERQWSILEEITEDRFVPSMFARQRDSSAAAVSKTVRQLLEKELVTVSVSKRDGRLRDYELTPKGRRAMTHLREQRERAIREVWLSFPESEVAAFADFGRVLAERLESYARRAAPGRGKAGDHG